VEFAAVTLPIGFPTIHLSKTEEKPGSKDPGFFVEQLFNTRKILSRFVNS
jgi:hypothetical protein